MDERQVRNDVALDVRSGGQRGRDLPRLSFSVFDPTWVASFAMLHNNPDDVVG